MKESAYFDRGHTTHRKKVEFTVELLERIGATGKTLKLIAKDLGVAESLVSRNINKTLTTRRAYDKGKEAYERSIRKV